MLVTFNRLIICNPSNAIAIIFLRSCMKCTLVYIPDKDAHYHNPKSLQTLEHQPHEVFPAAILLQGEETNEPNRARKASTDDGSRHRRTTRRRRRSAVARGAASSGLGSTCSSGTVGSASRTTDHCGLATPCACGTSNNCAGVISHSPVTRDGEVRSCAAEEVGLDGRWEGLEPAWGRAGAELRGHEHLGARRVGEVEGGERGGDGGCEDLEDGGAGGCMSDAC